MDAWLVRAALKADAALGGQPGQYQRELVERARLTPEEASAIVVMNLAWWNSCSYQILRVSELTVGERAELDWYVYGQYASGRFPAARRWYELTKPFLNPDAVRYVDTVLARPAGRFT